MAERGLELHVCDVATDCYILQHLEIALQQHGFSWHPLTALHPAACSGIWSASALQIETVQLICCSWMAETKIRQNNTLGKMCAAAWIVLCTCTDADRIHISLSKTGAIVKNFFTQLNNMLTAIAYAEAGDLDAVKQILQAQSNHARWVKDKESKVVSEDTQVLPAV